MTKLQKIRNSMSEKGVDALLVLDELNQRYLSDFAFTDGYLVITANEAYLVTDFRYYEMALGKASSEFSVFMPEDRHAHLASVFADNGVKTVGFEDGSVSYSTYKAYAEKYPSQEFVGIGNMIELLRQIKSVEEIRKIQAAQDITDMAFSHVLGMLTPEMTELDVAVEIEYAMRKAGADGFAFDTIAVSGDASALPHGTARNVKLRPGFLTMDFGAKLDGYCSDMTRTVVIGKADAGIKKLYNTVLTAQTAALDFIKEGINCKDADTVARVLTSCHFKFVCSIRNLRCTR